MSESHRGAGRSSQEKYDSLTRSWRRRNRKVLYAVAAICSLVNVGSYLVAVRWPGVAWLAGVLGGVALAFWLIARWSPPGWIENWQTGAWGEQATAKVLTNLDDDQWVVMHDLPAGRGNIDHIVVGPAGVFLLDSKRLGGSVRVDDGHATVRRFDDPTLDYSHPGAAHLLRLATHAHHEVLTKTRLNVWVTPVMVLWADFPQRVAVDRCAFVHGNELTAWLHSQPQRIAPERVRQVADLVRHSLEPGPTHAD